MKTTRYIPANILILQLLLIIAVFIRQARIGCYGNSLIDIEENPNSETFLTMQVTCYPKQLPDKQVFHIIILA